MTNQERWDMLEHLKQNRRDNYGPGICKMQKVMNTLDESDRQILDDVMANVDRYSTYGIFRGLRDAGVVIGYATLDRHRKNICPCGVNHAE